MLAITNYSNAQIVTLDYSSYSSNDCDVFGNAVPVQGILHETKRGDVTKNSSQGALGLQFNYNNNSQKGTEYSIFGLTFKKEYKYVVKITAKNNNSYSEPAGLKCNFDPFGIDPSCNGVNYVNSDNGTFSSNNNWFQVVNGTAFVEYIFESDYLTSAQSTLGIGTYSLYNFASGSNFIQTIFIQKIEITEIAPPPSFTLSPTTQSLACGDTSAKTFTVTPANIPSGANVTYTWSYNGWSVISSSATSKTLQPNPGSGLPSNVSVTPYVNGVVQPTKTCIVTRAPYTSSYSISGAGSLCSSSNYSITGLQSNETIQWSLSNTTIATLSNITTNSVTVNKVGNGTVDLIATILNSCNQTTTKSKSISMGAPSFSTTNMSGDSNPLTGETIVYNVQKPSGYTSLQWYFDYAGTTGTSVNGWEILNGQGTTAITAKVGNPGLTYVVCKAFNSCSNSIQYMPVSVRSITDPCYNFKINVKNPIKESDNLVGKIVPPPIDPCDDLNAKLIDKKERKKIQVFDLFGRIVFSGEFVEDNFDLHLDKITKGTYLLNITLQDGKTQHETIIVQ